MTAAEENIDLPDFLVAITDGQTASDINLNQQVRDTKKGIIIYFYPKDNTPGCSTQAIDFTSDVDKISALGYQVIGVSRDGIESHNKFIEKKEIGFSLISDPDEKLCKHFDVIREKNMYGKKTLGIHRSTFIFDADGKLQHALRNVRAKGHVERVVKLLG